MTKPAAGGREIALDILIEILEKGGYSHVVLRQALAKYQYLPKQERAFISRTVEGTVEYLLQIDSLLDEYSKVKVNKMKPVIRNLLRMSVYQILYMDRVPDSAVCDEAVKLAAKRRFTGLKGFVNGVLRSVARHKDEIAFPTDSLRYSMPEWIFAMWRETYGEETAGVMVRSFLEDHRTAVRCNLARAGKQEIIESLRDQGVSVAEAGHSDSMLYLEDYDYLESLEAFRKGFIQVQDVSSSLVGEAASPAPGAYVIDVCGAPGGKGLHLADRLKGTGMVEVRDLSDQKVQMIQDNIDRSGFDNIRARRWDALEFDPGSEEKADIVIADLPCSGLGIIGRKPDIKYRMTPEALRELSELQRQILSVVWRYVKPGGMLIYSTCTVDRAENEDNAEWFLEQFPFDVADLRERLREPFAPETPGKGWVQLLPGVHPCDGFFIAAFVRKERNDGKDRY